MSGGIYNLNPVAQPQQTPLSRGTETSVSVTATTTASVALAANANRATYSIFNQGPGTIFLREGATVAANLYKVKIPSGFYWTSEPSVYRYTGQLSVLAETGTAVLMVSESVLS
jgi:hypothetical protein